MNPESRYHGTYQSLPFAEEQTIWSDDLSEVKQWVLRHREEQGWDETPYAASIFDHETDTYLYRETGDE